MNLTEAIAVVELIDVHWPKAKLGDETKKSWALLICKAEPNSIAADGYEAIRDLAAHQGYAPSLAEVILGIHGARLSRPKPERLPEPLDDSVSFAQFLHDQPDMAERIKKIENDKAHPDSPIPDALRQLLLMSGIKPRSKVDRVRARMNESAE